MFILKCNLELVKMTDSTVHIAAETQFCEHWIHHVEVLVCIVEYLESGPESFTLSQIKEGASA